MYVSKDQARAVVFAFDVYPRYAEKTWPVRLQGLEANRMYRVKEINRMPGAKPAAGDEGTLYSGEYLMTVGLPLFTTRSLNSRVLEVVAE